MKAFLYSYFKGANFNLKDSLPKFKNFGYDGQSKYVIQKQNKSLTCTTHQSNRTNNKQK